MAFLSTALGGYPSYLSSPEILFSFFYFCLSIKPDQQVETMWDRDFNEIESNVCFYSLQNYRILQAKMEATGKSNFRNQRRNLSSRSTISLQAATFNLCIKFACADPEGGGGQGVWTPLKITKN